MSEPCERRYYGLPQCHRQCCATTTVKAQPSVGGQAQPEVETSVTWPNATVKPPPSVWALGGDPKCISSTGVASCALKFGHEGEHWSTMGTHWTTRGET